MRINQINVYPVKLPFRGDFSISRLKGRSSETIVVEIIAHGGEITGNGEGIPLEFVTGETLESTVENIDFLTKRDSFPWILNDISQIKNFVEDIPECKELDAAVCALETGLLDLLGKSQNRPVIDYFPNDHSTDKICYGASITLGDQDRVRGLSKFIKETLGIKNHIRIKMDKDLKQNEETVKIVRQVFGNDCELRMDPNTVWDYKNAQSHLPFIKEYMVKVVEEPMSRYDPDLPKFAHMVQDRGAILMACESAPTLIDVEKIIKKGLYGIINVKISRSGGFHRALKIIETVRESQLSFQIGCSLGESGILSAAGRTLCLLCGDAKYYDGSYDQYVLAENTTVKNVSFGYGGEAGSLEGSGLGVTVDSNKLEKSICKGFVKTILKP